MIFSVNIHIMRHRMGQWAIGWTIGLLIVLLSAVPSLARSSTSSVEVLDYPPLPTPGEIEPIAPAPGAPGIQDPQELATFIDNYMAGRVPEKAPGAAVAIVRDGEILFAKGYGYANIEQKIPVEADRTLFRVASLSKLFTATATMQLYEQGKLDIHDDITPYLGDAVAIENPYDAPVTFAQMMMHTDGSTKRRVGLASRTAEEMPSLEAYLARNMPPIVYPPGKLYSYSSHTIALLGYLVQRISGEPFNDYIDRHIFQPLGMTRSSFRQPPPTQLQNDLATGYQARGNSFKPVSYLNLNIGPAAALSATVTDMARFAIAHLEKTPGDNAILQPETLELMHSTHFRPHSRLSGTGYSFRERLVNNRRVIGHLGSLRGYSSSLSLIPDRNLGIVIISNSFSGIHEQLLGQFFDRYFPDTSDAPTPRSTVDSLPDPGQFTGSYWDLEYPRHTLMKLSAFYQRIRIHSTPDGLQIDRPNLFFASATKPVDLEPVEPFVFRKFPQGKEPGWTAFETDSKGNIEYAYNPVFPKISTYKKAAWWQNIWLQMGLLGASLLVLLSAVWVWPLHPLVRLMRAKRFQVARSPFRAWVLAGVVASLNLLFIIGFPLGLWLYGGWKLAYGMPSFAVALLGIPVVTIVLNLPIVAISAVSWGSKEWHWRDRLHYATIAIAALGFSAWLAYWNLLGWQY